MTSALSSTAVLPATSNGTITLDGSSWLIACQPHVRTKLRRVFPQVSQRAADVIKLSDSDENARDLLWFIDRYEMEVDPKALRWMRERSKRHVDAEATVAQLLASHVPPTVFALAEPAREYQNVAATLAMIKGGLLVADDVGVGKTVTGLAPLAVPGHLPALIVVEAHLLIQWAQQLKRFLPHLTVHTLKTGQPYELRPRLKKPARRSSKSSGEQVVKDLFGPIDQVPEFGPFPDVILCNFHKLNGWAETLAGVCQYVAFDECHNLRHDSSARYAAAKLVASKAILRIGLSATPIFNVGSEMFNVVDVLRPGVLGLRDEFYREWCDQDGRVKEPRAFGTYLRREGIMLRRTRKDVGRELPPFQVIPHTIDSDAAALDKIKGSAIELAKIILATTNVVRGAAFHASEEFSNLLRQATGIAKMPYVAEFIRMLLATEKKVVCFLWHRACYDILMQELREFQPVMYSGSESQNQKAAAKAKFVDPDSGCRVMLISLRAGSGLDGLQHVCSVGVFAELDYSPAVGEQCAGRYYRDGQEMPSLAYYLLAEDGSDPAIAEILGIKTGQIQGVRDPNADLLEEIQADKGNVKKLATAFLKSVNVEVPTAEAPAALGSA